MTPKQAVRRPMVRDTRREVKKRSHPYGAWQLPSGKRLAEFALASGFLAPPLMENGRPNSRREKNAL